MVKSETQFPYVVTILVDGIEYIYVCLSSNHDEALQMAIVQHMAKDLPLPLGTPCLVEGVCADPSCNCGGKIRMRGYYTLPKSHLC
jgi:hypothetical protein